MALVHDGQSRAFEVIFDRHAGAAFSLAYRIVRPACAREDIVQEAFLSLWRTGARYDRGRGSVRSWVLSAVHKRTVDTFRREQVKERLDVPDEGIAARLPSPRLTETEVEHRDDARLVRSAMAQLPSEQRQVIELAYFGGFTHAQISDMLELPSGTVKGRMRLGLSKLRLSLGDPAQLVSRQISIRFRNA
jgi:RNA polymerase sigma-70 factor (ECF subfamily)